MKTSTETGSIAQYVGEEKAVELIGKAGFDAWDFSMMDMAVYDWETNKIKDVPHPLNQSQYLKFVRELKKIGEAYGMVCNQSHAPFPSDRMPMDVLKRCIECTAEAGGRICVIHPIALESAEVNTEFYQSILPFAKAHDVKIATENMWNWLPGATNSCFAACATSEDFVRLVDMVNDPYLVACLDIGHAEMRGSGSGAANMIRALGNRLQALHIHDNDLINDNHQIPFSMNIDFSEVAKALKDINYDGFLTLEAITFLQKGDEESLLAGVKQLLESIKRFDRLITD